MEITNPVIIRYLNEQQANGNKPATIEKEKPTLAYFDKIMQGHIEQANKDDITSYINSWKATDSTKATRKIIIKKFFNSIGKENLVKDIKVRNAKNNLKPDDILNVDDVSKLIDATESYYYKALIAFSFESGARFQEIQSMKRKDFVESEKGLLCSVPTFKTDAGYRNIILIYSAQYMRNFFMYAALKPDNVVFHYTRQSVDNMLVSIAKAAHITKPLSMHKFRHAQATDMVKRGYNETIIRKKLGWTASSNMIARYAHPSDSAVIDATLEHAGQDVPREPIKNLKQAESIKIADTSLQMAAIQTENSELKKRLDEQQEQLKAIIISMSKAEKQ